MIKNIAMVFIGLVTAAGGVWLYRYADVDDSPGGMLFATLVVLAALVVAAIGIQRATGGRRES